MKNKLTIEFASRSHQGLVRKENQDCYGKFPENNTDLTHPTGQLFLVADGMGGHQGGKEASKMAVNIVQESYFSESSEDIPTRLQKAFENANAKIHQHASHDPRLHGMGTTCTALVLKDDRGYIAHVGDSGAYRITRTKIEKMTQDHSQVAEMMRQGILTEAEAKVHPHRSILTRALGTLPEIEVDILNDIWLYEGDYFLLCSDGLAKVGEEEIKSILLSNAPDKACSKLVQLANDAGGEDNVTVLIIAVLARDGLGRNLKDSFKKFWK